MPVAAPCSFREQPVSRCACCLRSVPLMHQRQVIRYNATDRPMKMAVFPQYQYPQVCSSWEETGTIAAAAAAAPAAEAGGDDTRRQRWRQRLLHHCGSSTGSGCSAATAATAAASVACVRKQADSSPFTPFAGQGPLCRAFRHAGPGRHHPRPEGGWKPGGGGGAGRSPFLLPPCLLLSLTCVYLVCACEAVSDLALHNTHPAHHRLTSTLHTTPSGYAPDRGCGGAQGQDWHSGEGASDCCRAVLPLRLAVAPDHSSARR